MKPTRRAGGDALTIAELGRRYLTELERQGRKRATVVAVESILRIWLEPFLGERDVRRISAEDVHDLIRLMEQGPGDSSSLEVMDEHDSGAQQNEASERTKKKFNVDGAHVRLIHG